MKLRNEEISLKESINELIKKEDNIFWKNMNHWKRGSCNFPRNILQI